VTTNDISPYLLRPVRSLKEAKAQAEQQRLELLSASVARAEKSSNAPATSPSDTTSIP
jgi:hypothetical protein